MLFKSLGGGTEVGELWIFLSFYGHLMYQLPFLTHTLNYSLTGIYINYFRQHFDNHTAEAKDLISFYFFKKPIIQLILSRLLVINANILCAGNWCFYFILQFECRSVWSYLLIWLLLNSSHNVFINTLNKPYIRLSWIYQKWCIFWVNWITTLMHFSVGTGGKNEFMFHLIAGGGWFSLAWRGSLNALYFPSRLLIGWFRESTLGVATDRRRLLGLHRGW